MSSTMNPEKFITVARTGDLTDGTMKGVSAGGREVLLAFINGHYYAAENVCPHMGARLSDGFLDGTVLTCPRHHSKFDLIDGRVVRWTDWTGIKASVSKLFRPPRPLPILRVRVDGDNIQVEL